MMDTPLWMQTGYHIHHAESTPLHNFSDARLDMECTLRPQRLAFAD